MESEMAGTTVGPEQFEISDKGITHKPTGYSFTPHPGNPASGNARIGHLGDKLESGEDYRPSEVEAMAKQLWAEYVKRRWPNRVE
jgi:hypothetical protein